jgi:surface-adhesin protein E
MIKIHSQIILFLVLTFSATFFAQNKNDLWKPINFDPDRKIYIDLVGLENYIYDDIYVWVLEEFDKPFELESRNEKIFTSKTYYLFNKKLNMYSILEIIYYDEKDAITEYFNYWRDTNIESYNYNYPIMPNSIEESILNNCTEYIDKVNAELE